MKLLTKELEKKLPALYAQDGKGDKATAYVKFFYPLGHATWFATEYDPEQRLFFGWCELFPGCGEYGYFSLDEMESVKGPLGLGVERDLNFDPKPVGEAITQWKKERGAA